MKKVILSVAVMTALGLVSCKNETPQDQKQEATEVSVETTKTSSDMAMTMTETSFGVRGNCGMCKETIEEATNSVEGVTMANWDKDKKKIDVKFDESTTDMMAIHKAIAASGYDTDKVEANEEAYNNLPECCQYDHGMMMSQSGKMMMHDDHDHDH